MGSQVILRDAFKIVLGLTALIYAALVVSTYEIEGPDYHPRFQFTRPAQSSERLLIWTGVKILHTTLKMSRSILNQFYAASAEVGDWVVEKSSPSVQRKVRSKFL